VGPRAVLDAHVDNKPKMVSVLINLIFSYTIYPSLSRIIFLENTVVASANLRYCGRNRVHGNCKIL
jgi:hypothetical protein